MSLYYKDKCLICLKTGGNLNIFTTYNISDGKEELYVDVIKICFNIEITLDSGLHEMCNDCSLKLRKAYNFRKCIVDAVNELILAKVSETTENVKQYPDIQYIDDIPFENEYDVDAVLNTETVRISYNLDNISVNDNYSDGCAFGLDNDEDSNEVNVKQAEESIQLSVGEKGGGDPLLALDHTGLVPFIEKNTNENGHDGNQITYFMDLSNILQVGIAAAPNEGDTIIQEIENKDEPDIVANHDDPYSLNILNDNCLNLLQENDISIVNMGNSVKHTVANDETKKTDTALDTRTYIPFVFTNESDKKEASINVSNVIVADVDKVSKTSKCKKVTIKVVRMKANKTNAAVNISSVSDTAEKINENSRSAAKYILTEKKEICQTNIKKTAKRKCKSKTLFDPGNSNTFALHKDNEHFQSDCSVDVDNDLPIKKEVKKSKKGKKTVKKGVHENNQSNCSMDVDNGLLEKKEVKKSRKGKATVKKDVQKQVPDIDTVKENVPAKAEDVKPEKKNKKEPKVDPIDQFYIIMPGQTECSVCSERFESTILLRAHMRAHPPKYICAVCGTKLDTKFKYKVHMRTHQKGPFYCKFCKKEFAKINTRNTHEWRVHSKPEPFKCSQCGERFKTYLRRLRHLQTAHGTTTEYPCGYCDKTFAYAAYRTKHIHTKHLDSRPYQCDSCPAAFARRGDHDAHRACKHGVGELRHRCGVCGRRFYAQPALRWHVAHIHRFCCSHCEQRFKTEGDLEKHTTECTQNKALETHTKTQYTQNMDLEQHTKTQYTQNMDLEQHTKAQYTQNMDLETHTKTQHTQNMDLEQHTKTQYTQNRDLETHTKTPYTHNTSHDSLDMSMSLDLMTTLPLDVLADDYTFMDSAYLDLNEL